MNLFRKQPKKESPAKLSMLCVKCLKSFKVGEATKKTDIGMMHEACARDYETKGSAK